MQTSPAQRICRWQPEEPPTPKTAFTRSLCQISPTCSRFFAGATIFGKFSRLFAEEADDALHHIDVQEIRLEGYTMPCAPSWSRLRPTLSLWCYQNPDLITDTPPCRES